MPIMLLKSMRRLELSVVPLASKKAGILTSISSSRPKPINNLRIG